MSTNNQALINKRARVIRSGEDATLSVGRWVRYLASAEARSSQTMGDAVVMQPELGTWPGFMRDLFADLYGLQNETNEAPSPAVAWIGEVLKQAHELPEWGQLRRASEGDPWRCSLSTHAAVTALEPVIRRVLDAMKKAEEADQQRRAAEEALAAEQAKKRPSAAKVAKLSKQAEEAGELAAEAGEEARQSIEGQAVAALRNAAKSAQQAIAGQEEALAGLGCGTGSNAASAVTAPRDDVQEALRKSDRLRRIAKIAGRMRLSVARCQRAKNAAARSEIYDVGIGDDVSRLVASEIALLADPDLELLLLHKLCEGEAQVYELRGEAPAERGPLIVAVDGSGSMSGAPHEWAMGVALALLEVAAKQRRPFELVHFDSRVTKTWRPENPRRVELAELVAAVCWFSNGGTDFTPPLVHAQQTIARDAKMRKADVVLITDGAAYGHEQQLKTVHAKGIRTFAIGIGAADDRQLKAFGSYAKISDLNPGSAKLDFVFGL